MKKEINDLIEWVIFGIVLGAFSIFGIVQYNIVGNKIDNLTIQIKSSERITDYTIRGIESDINKNYKDLNRKIEQVPELIKETKLALEAKLKQVNVFITNKTVGATGSGVTLKYKGKFYVLSAGHMADTLDDKLFLSENGQEICELEIVKQSYDKELTYESNDLILLRPKDPNIVPRIYVELADTEPEISNELYIVGNPLGLEDVVSDARVTVYKGKFMLIKGDSYFGNSGGGIYTREGKLVGIMSFIYPIQPFPDRIVQPEDPAAPLQLIPGIPAYVINGVVRLSQIQSFLEGVE